MLTYGVNRAADVMPGPLSFTLEGLAFDVRTPRGVVHASSKLVGKPNVYNVLAAVATTRELRRRGHFAGGGEPDLREQLDLVALSTVCDVMPLVGLNRAFVVQGLKVLGGRRRPGLRRHAPDARQQRLRT